MKILVKLVGVGIGVLLLLITAGFIWIRVDVATHCREAQAQYSGDCVAASLALLKDERQSFQARNDAVWVLGQYADPRALATLESFYTGNIPDREPLAETLSQYELRKAIKWCKEGNVTSWMY